MDPIIIIGTGLAGYNLAKEIRKIDKTVPLQLLTADAGESYSKPMLSNALNKGKSASQLVLSTAQQMSDSLPAIIHTHTRVETIDTQAHQVVTSNGNFRYRQLALAIGASPMRPAFDGNAAADVFSINSLDDYARFRVALETAEHVGIIGPGLIGCEFANDLISVGKTVSVIGPSTTPLDRLMPTVVGNHVAAALSEAGIRFYLGKRVIGVDKAQQQYQLQFSDQSSLLVDLVVSAIGLRSNTTLAESAGIRVDKGIVVDRQLQCSSADIYALGDCMEIEGLVLPFVLPLMHAARTLAKTLTGTPTPLRYPAMPVVIKTPAHPIVVSPPAASVEGEWAVDIDKQGARALYHNTIGDLAGFVLTGNKLVDKQKLTQQLPMLLE